MIVEHVRLGHLLIAPEPSPPAAWTQHKVSLNARIVCLRSNNDTPHVNISVVSQQKWRGDSFQGIQMRAACNFLTCLAISLQRTRVGSRLKFYEL
jgi:hypothetical protein